MPTPDLGFFERVSRSAQEAVIKTRVRSALYPLLALCALVTVPCAAGALFATGGLRIAFFILAALPVVLTGVAYVYFMLNEPDRLQSEEHIIQKRALALIEEKGGSIPLSPTSLEAIANPRGPGIGAGEGHEAGE